MSNEILNDLLRDYEQKKFKAELDLEKRKESLYNLYPRLQEIEDELNSFAIKTTKNILNNTSNSLLDLNIKATELRKEKEAILRKAQISENYLKPFYECNKCKDTGYITQNNSKTIMCTCLKQKLLNNLYNKSNISNLKAENFSTFNESLFSNDVDFAKYKLNISPRNNILNIKNKCIEFVENFDKPNTKNLLFTGNTGLR